MRDLTDGRGVDVVRDPVGGELLTRSIDCLALDGCPLPLGFASGEISTVDAGRIVAAKSSLVGVSWATVYPRAWEEVARRAHAELVEMYAARAIRPAVPRTWTVDEVPDTLQQLADRESVGKSVVVW